MHKKYMAIGAQKCKIKKCQSACGEMQKAFNKLG